MSAIILVSDKDRKRLTDLLGRLGSEHDGERSAAAFHADRHLRYVIGWTWEELVEWATRPAPIALPARPPRPWRTVGDPAAQLRFVKSCWGFLNPWERGFARSLDEQDYPLTERQREKLAEVAERVAKRCGAAAEAAE